MAVNKYCNLYGENKIKDDYTKINDGFSSVETDVTGVLNSEAARETAETQREVNEANRVLRYENTKHYNAYNPGATYHRNNIVSQGGCSYMLIVDESTGNAPPVYPAESNTWWAMIGKKGDKGDTGAVPNIQIGTVTTILSNQQATVTRQVGSPDTAPVFNFGIPKGQDGTGAGDMTKADYDVNNDGVVNDSDKLGGQLPSYYAKQQDFELHLSNIAYHGTMARQAIINGNFNFWQRGTNFTNPPINSYTSDRWITAMNTVGTFPTVTHSRQPLTTGALSESFYYYNINVNGAGSGYGANDYYVMAQKIENGTRFLCGAGRKITLSFWAKSNISNKKIGIYGYQSYGTGGSPSTTDILVGTTFTLTSSWTKYTVTFDTHTLTGKTFGTNNDDHLDIDFTYLWGDTFASIRINTSVSENFIGAGDISIAQVQLCAGDTALSFSPKSYAEELILCQRYYEIINNVSYYLYCDNTPRSLDFSFKITKRVAPTCKVYDGLGNENKMTFVTSGYLPEHNKPLYGDVPVSSLSTVTIAFIPPAGYINVGFIKLIADAEL